MRYRKLDENNDYTFGASQKNLWRDVPEAVAQAVETRLLLWLGEWFLDLTEGTPWLQGILGKHSQALANTVIQDRILGTQNLTGISDFSSTLDPDNRVLNVSATVNTLYGTTDLEVLNFANS